MNGLQRNNTLSGRSKATCSFCGQHDHQSVVCPYLPSIWKELKNCRIPVALIQSTIIDVNATNSANGQSGYGSKCNLTWLVRPAEWGKLYIHTERAWEKKVARDNRLASKAKTKKARKKAVVCGYCGSDGHSRRTCSHLLNSKNLLKKAQSNYRRYVYDTLVVERGLSSGAIIKVTEKGSGYYSDRTEPTEHTTLCTGVNWNSINLFAEWTAPKTNRYGSSAPAGWDRLQNIIKFCESAIYLTLPSLNERLWSEVSSWRKEGSTHLLFPLNGGSCLFNNSLQGAAHNKTFSAIEIVSRAPQNLPEDWIGGYSDELNVIFKKFSKAELDYLEINEHIEKWANLNNDIE